MKLSAIALKNLKRNFSFYSLYLFSVSFVLMIYFCFTSFSMNQIIMEKISSDGRVETMCRTVAVFIMAFVIFYMFYSNSFFMRRRMRELGIYSLLGYRKSTILKTSVYKGYKRDKIEMRGDRAEMSDFPLYLNTVAGGLDRRDQTIGGFSFVVKIYAVPVVEIIG